MSSKKQLRSAKKHTQTLAGAKDTFGTHDSREQIKNDDAGKKNPQVVKLDGSGAIAQGEGAKAVGQDGILIDIKGNVGNIVIDKRSDFGRKNEAEKKRISQAFQDYKTFIKDQVDSTTKSSPVESPYKALSEYEFRDAPIFFGRDQMVQKIIGRIYQSSLTVLYSGSGAGKSSLLQAGVEPQLAKLKHIPLHIRPIDIPISTKIKQTLLSQLLQSPILVQMSMRDFLKLFTAKIGKGQWLVIIVDQFEEFFTLQKDEDRRKFMSELAECLSDKTLAIRWLFSLRGEWLYQLDEFQDIIPNLYKNGVLLNGLSEDEATKVIINPARQYGVSYEEQVIREIKQGLLADSSTASNEISPPDLQIICTALFEKNAENKLITYEDFNSLGGTNGILQQHLERELKKFSGSQRIVAQQVLVSLVSSEIKGGRNIYSAEEIKEELSNKGTNTLLLDDILKQLINRHLLRIVEKNINGIEVQAYELSHERLIKMVELDSESQKQKIAREILEFKFKYELLLTPSELNIIEPYKNIVVRTQKEQKLLQDSKRNRLFARLVTTIAYLLTFGTGLSVILAIAVAIINIVPQITNQGYVSLLFTSLIAFSVFGANRGWAKELLVSFSAILALALNLLLRQYVPLLSSFDDTSTTLFWARLMILLSLTYL
ncbi:MAG: hypothetical protein JJE09_06015, partial [Bacteroidia bacterium]|nr:hypothetical protein [Bacteroidia bacterium]